MTAGKFVTLFTVAVVMACAEPPVKTTKELCLDIKNRKVDKESAYLAQMTLSVGVSIILNIKCPSNDVAVWLTNEPGESDVGIGVERALSRISDLFLKRFSITKVEVVAVVRSSPGMFTAMPAPGSDNFKKASERRVRGCRSKEDSHCFKILQFVVLDPEYADLNP